MANRAVDQNYEEAIAFLTGRENYERGSSRSAKPFQLDSMRELLNRLGNPQDTFPAIHIAGTKGKGSTAAMISAVSCEAGYRVGLYTSPHLNRVEERFVIDGLPCSESQLADLLLEVRPLVEAMDREGEKSPTYFEVTTAVAMLYFAQQRVDLAVLEVGMGGRLDSTNVCNPTVTVITSVSLDHTRELGDTLSLIAKEKAGIIKPGVPVVSGVADEAARVVVAEQAREKGAPLWELNDDFEVAAYRPPAPGKMQSTFDFKANRGPLKSQADLPLGLLGRHQADNAALAIAVIDLLAADGWKYPGNVCRALSQVRCCGRVELIPAGPGPVVVIDAAHNVASTQALLDTLEEIDVGEQRILIFASSSDKDLPGMLRLLVPRFEHVILTRYLDSSRAARPQHLADLVEQVRDANKGQGASWEVQEDPQGAWEAALDRCSGEGAVCVTGSFFIAAHMRRLARHSDRSRLPDLEATGREPVDLAI